MSQVYMYIKAMLFSIFQPLTVAGGSFHLITWTHLLSMSRSISDQASVMVHCSLRYDLDVE